MFYLLPKHIDPLMYRPYGKTTAADNRWWSIHKPTIHPNYSTIRSTSSPTVHPTSHLHLCITLKQNAKCTPVSVVPSFIHSSFLHKPWTCTQQSKGKMCALMHVVMRQNIRNTIKYNYTFYSMLPCEVFFYSKFLFKNIISVTFIYPTCILTG